jgi:hypothetical protein
MKIFNTPSPQLKLGIVLLILILPILACGFIGGAYQTNNQVRLAVYQYEISTRSRPDDLVLDFQRDEPRIKFEGQNENGGRTVWLYRLGAKEFFKLRPPDKTYMYIQQIEYGQDGSTATVTVYRGDGNGYQGRTLTLTQDNGNWSVSGDEEITDNASSG